MHIFITGIAGFLGANLADYYVSKKFKVSGCDNLVGGTTKNINLISIKFGVTPIRSFNITFPPPTWILLALTKIFTNIS